MYPHPGGGLWSDHGQGGGLAYQAFIFKEHKLIGEYFNINTPVELYPYGTRYLDLEADVVFGLSKNRSSSTGKNSPCCPGTAAFWSDLEKKAAAVAENLLQTLSACSISS